MNDLLSRNEGQLTGFCGTEGGSKFLDIDICVMSNTEPVLCAC